MLKLSADIREAIIRQAVQELPNESCGYLAGVGDEIREGIPMINVDHSPEHFSFDPAEQFQALKTARSKELSLIAVYHSHPETPARLSEEDIRLANDPRIVYIIVSLAGDAPEIRGYRVNNKEVTEVPIQIIEGEHHG